MKNTENTPYEIMGGDLAIRSLVVRFYDIMDSDPAAKALRELHPDELIGSIDKLYKFLSGWLGGPALYMEEFGHPRLRARHMPFPIDDSQRDQWLYCMFKAMKECNVDETLQATLRTAFTQTADHMINRSPPV